jgi:hypothetical protein
MYAEQEYRKLVAKAIRRVTSTLVHSFITTVESDLVNEPIPVASARDNQS